MTLENTLIWYRKIPILLISLFYIGFGVHFLFGQNVTPLGTVVTNFFGVKQTALILIIIGLVGLKEILGDRRNSIGLFLMSMTSIFWFVISIFNAIGSPETALWGLVAALCFYFFGLVIYQNVTLRDADIRAYEAAILKLNKELVISRSQTRVERDKNYDDKYNSLG